MQKIFPSEQFWIQDRARRNFKLTSLHACSYWACCRVHAILKLGRTPRHSNLLWLKIFCFDSSWRIRGGLDLWVSCAYAVPWSVLWTHVRHPDIRTCSDAKKFVLSNNFVIGVGSIWTTTTACECHVHMWSHVVYYGPMCDTQTFELAVMQKNLSSLSGTTIEIRSSLFLCQWNCFARHRRKTHKKIPFEIDKN